ncbi:MAG: glycosyltransferase, partial [Salegentibacter mishustinae]|nr:glycosyltransferase [Salegentibacter mishustinae]
MQQFEQSLIISFYNGVEKLRMIIKALERQTERNFEVIIADDGSSDESVQAVNKIIEESNLTINHLWHEDKGFRKVIILNEAIRHSRSNYLVFIDGDCIPHKDFMKGHLESQEQNCFLAGRRVNLSEKLTKKLNATRIKNGYLDSDFRLDLIKDGLFGKTTHFEKGFYI